MRRKSAKGRRNHQRRCRERMRLRATDATKEGAEPVRRYLYNSISTSFDDIFTVPLPFFSVRAAR